MNMVASIDKFVDKGWEVKGNWVQWPYFSWQHCKEGRPLLGIRDNDIGFSSEDNGKELE